MALEENNPPQETEEDIRSHLLRLQEKYPDHITQASKNWLAAHPDPSTDKPSESPE